MLSGFPGRASLTPHCTSRQQPSPLSVSRTGCAVVDHACDIRRRHRDCCCPACVCVLCDLFDASVRRSCAVHLAPCQSAAQAAAPLHCVLSAARRCLCTWGVPRSDEPFVAVLRRVSRSTFVVQSGNHKLLPPCVPTLTLTAPRHKARAQSTSSPAVSRGTPAPPAAAAPGAPPSLRSESLPPSAGASSAARRRGCASRGR